MADGEGWGHSPIGGGWPDGTDGPLWWQVSGVVAAFAIGAGFVFVLLFI